MASPTFQRIRRVALAATGLVLALGLGACGGGTPQAASPGSESSGEPGESGGVDGASGGGEAAEAEAALRSCADGTCIRCGEGECPLGFFCDESAKGGPACAWLPECAQKPACACVERVLSGSCEEKDGGVYFTAE